MIFSWLSTTTQFQFILSWVLFVCVPTVKVLKILLWILRLSWLFLNKIELNYKIKKFQIIEVRAFRMSQVYQDVNSVKFYTRLNGVINSLSVCKYICMENVFKESSIVLFFCLDVLWNYMSYIEQQIEFIWFQLVNCILKLLQMVC